MSAEVSTDECLESERIEELVRHLSGGSTAPAGGADETPPTRPVHVLYGGAQLFSAGAPEKMALRARAAMEEWGAVDRVFGHAVGLDEEDLAGAVAGRVRTKLADAPVEAMCIDFEDGYGPRSDAEEDADAVRTARELAHVPPGRPLVGIRVKPLAGSTARRAIRTLDRFVTTLARATNGALRPGFTVTIPKVEKVGEVAALVEIVSSLETKLCLAPIAIELMIETPRALLDERGEVATRALVNAGRGRVVAVHLGAYDLTAELGVTAGDQRLEHPYCDFARTLLAFSVGDLTSISDGATTVLPIAPKDAPPADGMAAVHRAWSLHARNVRRAIDFGIWQGWDLHPAQLPARYGALYAYFLGRKEKVAERLATFVARATQASRVGQVFDDAATARGLMTFFRRGLACGALDDGDLARTTLTRIELEARSFADIVTARSTSANVHPSAC